MKNNNGKIDVVFDEKKLENARQRVRNRERRHENDINSVYASVLEAIIYQQIRDGSWFGENTSAIKTSDFDDYVNGSDIVVELQDPARALYNLSLSIDVTFGTHTEEKKFSKIKKNTSGSITSYEVSAFEDYYFGKPYISKIIFKVNFTFHLLACV